MGVRFMGRKACSENVVIGCFVITDTDIRTLELCSRCKEERPPCPTVREDKEGGHANGRRKHYLC